MRKIVFADFNKIMMHDILNEDQCVEIEFCVDESDIYTNCWMGKMKKKGGAEYLYWYGLTEDGLHAYDYNTLECFIEARVFDGKSIKEIWDSVTILSIDSSDVDERLEYYTNASEKIY